MKSKSAKSYRLGTVIAQRKFYLNGKAFLTLYVGRPRKGAPGFYFCPYKMSGKGIEFVSRAGGVDGLQAMLLALQKISVDLAAFSEKAGAQLYWDGDKEGWGF